MNKDTVEGKYEQVAGTVKQKVGETFGNQSLANSGVAEQVKGAAKETWGKAKDVASERHDDAAVRTDAQKDDLKVRAEETFDNARDKVVNTAQKIKNDINEKIESYKEKHNA